MQSIPFLLHLMLSMGYFQTEVQYYPNSRQVIDEWIVVTDEMLKAVVIDNLLPVIDMPPV
eukprot:12134797-Ditylum_brightwellii.AAC.1